MAIAAIVLHSSLFIWRGTYILRHMGMCHSNGSLFHKKSLNMGPIFYKNIPKQVCFSKISDIVKNGHISRKIPKNGTFFWQNDR